MRSQSLLIASVIAIGFSLQAGKGGPIKRLYRSLATLLTLCLTTAACASDATPVSNPEALGFSSSRLERMAAWHTRMAFLHGGAGKPTDLVLNPGP